MAFANKEAWKGVCYGKILYLKKKIQHQIYVEICSAFFTHLHLIFLQLNLNAIIELELNLVEFEFHSIYLN
jgi:hypothetical protein